MQGEQKRGTHTPASTSITVAEVGKKWIEQAQADGLEPVTIAQLVVSYPATHRLG